MADGPLGQPQCVLGASAPRRVRRVLVRNRWHGPSATSLGDIDAWLSHARFIQRVVGRRAAWELADDGAPVRPLRRLVKG